MGVDINNSKQNELNLQPTLAKKWNEYISKGLDLNAKKDLIEKYPLEGNCHLSAPKLNPELASMLNEAAIRRDKHFCDSQNLLGAGMSALGMALSSLITNKEGGDRLDIIQKLSDTGKLLAELHHVNSIARRAYISPGLNKNIKPVMEKTAIGSFLYGDNLTEKIKDAKSMEKVAQDLKLAIPPSFKKPQHSNNLNWKTPPVRQTSMGQVGTTKFRPKYKSPPIKRTFPLKNIQYRREPPQQNHRRM